MDFRGHQIVFTGLLFAVTVIAIFSTAVLFSSFRTEPARKFSCICDIPTLGEKEVLVNILVKNDHIGTGALSPANLTLNVYNKNIPCVCKSDAGVG